MVSFELYLFGTLTFRVLDFSLVLATILTGLTNFIRPAQNNGEGDFDMDMIDIQGSGDAYESARAGVGLEDGDEAGNNGDSGGEDDDGAVAPAWEYQGGQSLLKVLKAFQMLKAEFDGKFKVMWA